uniref:Uncharacterized protein n=1 Tax=Helianthus annuus TaxID=4232 RepID=A0A2P1MA71_HELAN|nr:hypothetical protein [Helianthus annuus]AVP27565.1 hypothetical protein [Helianthus annuus]
MTSRGPPAVLFILFYLRARASAFMENAQLLFRGQAFFLSFFFLFLLGSSLGGPTRVYFTIPFSILFLRTFFLSLKCIRCSPPV